MGGAALHQGNIAEMKTGEGKTLVSTLPGYLNALDGQGRPRRDGQRLPGQARLGVDGRDLPVPRAQRRADPGVHDARAAPAGLRAPTSPTARTTSSASTTCATTWRCASRRCVQRGHRYAIVDEVDSILIDEARTPLIISGMVADSRQVVPDVRPRIAPRLTHRRGLRGRRSRSTRWPSPRPGVREGRGTAQHREPLRQRQHDRSCITCTTRSAPRSSTSATSPTS